MFGRIFLTLFALLFATFMVVSNPLSASAEKQDEMGTEEPAKSDESAAEEQQQEADDTLKPDEAAGDEAPKY